MINLTLLLKLISVHLLGDFFFQSKKMVKEKRKSGWTSFYLYGHAFIHAFLVYLVLFDFTQWKITLIVFLSHLLIDGFKVQFKKDNTIAFIIDQALHLIVLVLIWLAFTQQWNELLTRINDIVAKANFWLIITGYLLCLGPFGFLIGKITKNWQKQLKDDGKEGLDKAGLYIGYLERVLVFTFFIINQYAAIGFLLAAKSIFRFGDLKDSSDRKRTEYILFGSFLSFTLAVLLGIGVQLLSRLT